MPQGVFDVPSGERIVVVTAADDLAAERLEVVAMPAHGGLGQTLIQQIEQERREQLDDLLAHDEVRRLDVPGPRPVVQVRAGLAEGAALLAA